MTSQPCAGAPATSTQENTQERVKNLGRWGEMAGSGSSKNNLRSWRGTTGEVDEGPIEFGQDREECVMADRSCPTGGVVWRATQKQEFQESQTGAAQSHSLLISR